MPVTKGSKLVMHGMSKTTEYVIWSGMKQRCNDTNSKYYARYGGRGIKMCERWSGADGFVNFFEDMGSRPASATIDRIDNDGNYEPGNCRWTDRKSQANNRSSNSLVTYNGKTMNLKQWAEELPIPYSTLWRRIGIYKWSIDRAFTENVGFYFKNTNKAESE